ncbi:hypothetical protein RUND412_000225 [Rhizina undulata]
MLQSLFMSEYFQPSFTFENNLPTIGRSKMSGRESHRGRSPAPFTLPASSLAEEPIDLATPRSYSRPLSITPTITNDASDLQPWIYNMFQETYSDVHAYQTSLETQYMHGGDGNLMYPAPGPSSRQLAPMPIQAENLYSSGGVHRQEQTFYQQYELPSSQDMDRENKRVRLSPFSEYDSSSSEYDAKERGATPSLSDYSRSPQIASHSRASSAPRTATSSPSLSNFSPDFNAGTSAPTSNPSYSHLVPTFVAPKRRKSRRKLDPEERKKVHQLRKMGACTRCWGLKMKCGEGSPCPRCEKAGAGALCVRVHFVDLDVFSKWLVDAYSRTMMHHVLRWSNAPPKTITVSHERALGVAPLTLSVYEFIPAYAGQLDYWYKDVQGWQSMPTAPYALKRGINMEILEKYIDDHTWFYANSAFQGNPILSEIFRQAYSYSRTEENFLLRDALQLWTATQLLMRGATIDPSSDTLGISPILSPTALLANQIPPPRVLANQLDHLLERRVWQLEKQILQELQKKIFARKREDWLRIFMTLVVFMNALERDTWRLYYWVLHMEDGYVWRHPSTPQRLIEKNNTLAESLAAHFAAISKGLTPFSFDWTQEQTVTLIGNCEDPEMVLGALERIGKYLRNPDHALRVQNVHYRKTDERSLDFLYTSKVMVV